MKKAIALLLALVMVLALAACGNNANNNPSENNNQNNNTENNQNNNTPNDNQNNTPGGNNDPSGEGKSVGFVTFGMGGEFFEALANTYKSTMEAEGWTAYYVDGNFDPETQISAAENYIAMKVDVLVIWSVAPMAMGGVIEQAMEAGIKVIAFVAQTEKYDVLMVSDEVELASNACRLAAKWIDEHFAAEADHSVPVAVISYRGSETTAQQSDILVQIESFSSKAKFVTEVEVQDETAAQGQTAAENLYITNPEIKVFITPDNPVANGINNYYTSMSSPVTDYSDMGIFCINGDESAAENIKKSINDESPFRGTVMTGSVQDTANELRDMIIGITDGTVQVGHVQKAGTLFVYADTVEEYLTTGTVVSVTEKDFQ